MPWREHGKGGGIDPFLRFPYLQMVAWSDTG
jgi:hypothetical protein